MTKKLVVTLGTLAVIGLLAWLVIAPAAETEPTQQPVDAASSDVDASTPDDDSTTRRAPIGEVTVTLDVRLEGEPTSGRVFVHHGETRGAILDRTAGHPSLLLASDEGTTFEAGHHQFVQPLRHHSLVRVLVGRTVADHWIPPLAESGTRRIELDAPRRTLTVLVLRDDLRTAAADVAVECEISDAPGSRGRPTAAALSSSDRSPGVVPGPRPTAPDYRTGRTDESGVVQFTADGPAAFLVRAPGAAEFEGPPHAQRVVLAEHGPRTAQATLVLPEPRHEIEFVIRANIENPRAPGGKLFLRRIAGGAGIELPVPGSFGNGETTARLTVPDGTWRLDTLPTGRFRIPGGSSTLEVPDDGQRVVVYVEDNPARTRVELTGIPAHDYPLRVYPREEGAVHRHRIDVPFLGPRRWGPSPMTVPSLFTPVRLVAVSNRSCHVSTQPVRVEGESITVTMQPATCLTAQWIGARHVERPDDCTLVVTTPSGDSFFRNFLPSMASLGRSPRPWWVAELVVPTPSDSARTVLVECVGPEGDVLWQRRVTASGARTLIRVDESS